MGFAVDCEASSAISPTESAVPQAIQRQNPTKEMGRALIQRLSREEESHVHNFRPHVHASVMGSLFDARAGVQRYEHRGSPDQPSP
ncbi:hypothetical protein CDL15_Pgr028632 [Punica granatum]|nr:hypothetical protein CDL15_Pgr028632 [Punica granatum]